jgi:hypothetical protein
MPAINVLAVEILSPAFREIRCSVLLTMEKNTKILPPRDLPATSIKRAIIGDGSSSFVLLEVLQDMSITNGEWREEMALAPTLWRMLSCPTVPRVCRGVVGVLRMPIIKSTYYHGFYFTTLLLLLANFSLKTSLRNLKVET